MIKEERKKEEKEQIRGKLKNFKKKKKKETIWQKMK